ncbi:peptidoglycan DD-metalloendopeptidase family protein [Lentibacillus saliphilus]|uniref:peptidoglycan DD-metalloendopeptidase family protein n=1 Tax=Lentibacillus saliphilus TaxID=2737028 RepID=UPI001C2FD45B|nr:peptidoglycan DD-metalloendopeptidase family protein [Lentibacillus saliphilus]
MNENIKKVRKSIESRRKNREWPVKADRSHQIYPSLPQEEEKHGYFPLFSNSGLKKSEQEKKSYVTRFMMKGILAVMLFLSTAILMEADATVFSGTQQWTSTALSEEFPFAKVHLWYQETFGAPLAFDPNHEPNQEKLALPVGGQVVETFQSHGSGIMIAPDEATTVSALKSGMVIFAGNDRQTGKTIVVQHADNSISTYGFLSSIDVHVYQSVTADDQMGSFNPTSEHASLYFAIEKDNQPIDPIQVIQVDERP